MKKGTPVFERCVCFGLLLAAAPAARSAEPQRASDAQAATVTIYDQGFALVQELRRVMVNRGENDIVFYGLPRTLDAATTAFTVMAGVKPLELLEQTFSGSNSAQAELRWLVKSGGDGFSNMRLSYRAGGFGWSAAHELVLGGSDSQARFSTRVALQNQSGRTFDMARVKLALTERGSVSKLPVETGNAASAVPQRFAYGRNDTAADRLVAGLATLQTYELADPLALPDGPTKYVTMFTTDKLTVRRVYVYDGVRFDRFQRNRRTDRSYGTECRNIVDAFVEFDNDAGGGLGEPLPPGPLRLMQRRSGDVLDFLGETELPPTAAKASARARIGPARGLHGERERTGFAEIRQAHEYEESFEIRVYNESEEGATVRVVEHLYRSEDFEIVKADTEYKKTAAQTVEFSPDLKAGGQRAIHYTVRYRW